MKSYTGEVILKKRHGARRTGIADSGAGSEVVVINEVF
jgi:hypothetical protein